MVDHCPSLVALIKQLQRVPYLASKNLFRVAEHFLHMDVVAVEQFCKILTDLKDQVTKCSICCSWREKDRECYYCTAPKRDKQTICVVESWHDLVALEKTGGYQGVYHVLGGSICPLDGIGPEDLTIKQLLVRAQSDCKELIFAFNQTPEGEATSAYIASKLKNSSIRISCLARGLPVGSSLEAMDRLTIFKALSERRPF